MLQTIQFVLGPTQSRDSGDHVSADIPRNPACPAATMSLVDIRVDLPSYSRSFFISVSSVASVRQVKQEIYKTCPGQPRPEGQRLIWRGRLLSDDESVEILWKASWLILWLKFFILTVSSPILRSSILPFTHPLGLLCRPKYLGPNYHRLPRFLTPLTAKPTISCQWPNTCVRMNVHI